MHRIDNATAAVALPTPAAVGPKPNAYFTKGDPVGGIPATIVDDDWANSIQEELCYVLAQASIAPSKTLRTQLYSALLAIIAANPSNVARQGDFLNLKGSATGLSAVVTYTIDEIVTSDGASSYQVTRAWNASLSVSAALGAGGLDVGVLAANTWYYVYAITTAAGGKALIASLSSTAPSFTNAATYTRYARVGAFRTDGTANKFPLSFYQAGRSVQWKIAAGSNLTAMPHLTSGATGNVTTPTWTAVATTSFAPPTAASVTLSGETSNTGAQCIFAPNNSYGGESNSTNPPMYLLGTPSGGAHLIQQATLRLESTNVYIAATGAATRSWALAYEDNL